MVFSINMRTISVVAFLCYLNLPQCSSRGSSNDRMRSRCSVTCGKGTLLSPERSNARDSKFSANKPTPCYMGECPIDGGWSDWGYSYSSTCGPGFQNGFRTCTNPTPLYGGKDCGTDNTCKKQFSFQSCPDTGSCSVTCGDGTLVGENHQKTSIPCNAGLCPVNGGWSAWSFSICTRTCGQNSTMTGTRSCTNPPPSNGGSCSGASTTTVLNCLFPQCDDCNILVQKGDGSGAFNRSWSDYKAGFRANANNFWLGNDLLHNLTSTGKYKLHFDMISTAMVYNFAEYSTFLVGDEASKYILSVSGHSGNASDQMGYNNGHMFSTYDNDHSGHNCSVLDYGGWWHDHCTFVSATGYVPGSFDSFHWGWSLPLINISMYLVCNL